LTKEQDICAFLLWGLCDVLLRTYGPTRSAVGRWLMHAIRIMKAARVAISVVATASMLAVVATVAGSGVMGTGNSSVLASVEGPRAFTKSEVALKSSAVGIEYDAGPRVDGIGAQVPPIECPPMCPPELVVLKVVVNDDGGTGVVEDFTLRLDGVPITSGEVYIVSVTATHIVSEDSPAPLYAVTIGGDCAPDGRVAVFVSEHKTCVITNDDVPGAFPTWTPTPIATPSLTPTRTATLPPVGGVGVYPDSGEAALGTAGHEDRGRVTLPAVIVVVAVGCALMLGAAWRSGHRMGTR
jgi:hypothetical protein